MDAAISSDGVVLRIWRPADRPALAEIVQRSRRAFGDWLPGVSADLADLDAFLEHVERTAEAGTDWFYAIEEGGHAVGQCSLHDRGDGVAEIGYWVRSDRTGRGLATRAVTAVVDAALGAGFREVVLHCDEVNHRSAAVARKAGFTHVRTVDLPADRPRTTAQSGREMRWVRRMTAVDPTDEGVHPSEPEQLWNESWYFDFTTEDGSLGGYVRLGLYPALGVSWFWADLVGEGRPLVTVVDHEAPLPRTADLELRTEGLWTSLTCEEPLVHWTVGLEAFGVALDDPAEAYGACRGERTALGFDLEWETVGGTYGYPGITRYEVPCKVSGEVLVGRETIAFDGWGERDHSWGNRDWWTYPWTWTAGRLDDGTMWHASRPLIEGVRFEPGFVQPPGGTPEEVDRFTAAEERGREGLPTRDALAVGPLELAVEPRHFAPVRLDAPDGRVGRLARALSRAEAPDGRAGWCWMEWNQPPPAT